MQKILISILQFEVNNHNISCVLLQKIIYETFRSRPAL